MGDRWEKADQWNHWPTVFQASHHGEGSEKAERRFRAVPHGLLLFKKAPEFPLLPQSNGQEQAGTIWVRECNGRTASLCRECEYPGASAFTLAARLLRGVISPQHPGLLIEPAQAHRLGYAM